MKLNKKLFAVGGLAALAVVGATWAYFNQSTSITNPLSTGTFATSMVERFTPKTDWQPGVTVDKLVGAENTGDYPVLVRVKMDEKWMRKGSDTSFVAIASSDGIPFTDVSSEFIAKQYSKEDGFGEIGDTDGIVPALVAGNFDEADHSVVYKDLNTEHWVAGSDGYWYYKELLMPATTTKAPLLTAITLAKNVDTGKYTDGKTLDYVITEEADKTKIPDDAWITDGKYTSLTDIYNSIEDESVKEKIDNGELYLWSRSTSKTEEGLEGYSNANYELNITTEFIQATKDAVAAEWTTAPTDIADLAK